MSTGAVATGAKETRVLRVAGYCRYSSKLQDDGYSIEAQQHAILRDGEGWGHEHAGEAWGAVTWFEEPARSARHEKLALRTRLSDLLRAVEEGQYDLVVVHKLNRLARHLRDQLMLTARIAEAGAALHAVVERPDFSTPTGRLLANVMGSVAQYFVEDLGEETRKGLAARARERGLAVHRLPFGYRWPGGDSSQPPEYDVRSADAVDAHGRPLGNWHGFVLLKQWLLNGYTEQEVADRLNEDGRWVTGGTTRDPLGVPPSGKFTRETVRAIRSNVFYRPYEPSDSYGTVRHAGLLYRGAHQAGCTWDEWQSMQQIPRGRRRGWYHPPSPDLLPTVPEFRGRLACATCVARGERGTAYTRHAWSGRVRGEGTRYAYYRCHAQRRGEVCADEGNYARASDVRAAWLAWVRAHLALPDAWQERLRERALAWARAGGAGGAESDTGASRITRLTTERRAWLERRRRAIECYTEMLIDRAERDRHVAEADAQLARIRREETGGVGTDGAEKEAALARLINAGNFVADLADDWHDMTDMERARAAALLIEPRGFVVKFLGHGPSTRDLLETCQIVEVRLRPVFYELLLTIRNAAEETG